MTLTTIKDQAKTEKENERERETLRAKRRDLWRWSTREQKKEKTRKKTSERCGDKRNVLDEEWLATRPAGYFLAYNDADDILNVRLFTKDLFLLFVVWFLSPDVRVIANEDKILLFLQGKGLSCKNFKKET